MALDPRNRAFTLNAGAAAQADVDEGLRSYMLRVYNYMGTGLALTGAMAFMVAHTPVLFQLFYTQTPMGVQPTILAYIAMFSPLAFVLVLNFGLNRMSAATAQMVFWAFAAVMGLSMSHIFITFTGASVARVFFITSTMFLAMSLYGYTTKRDLSGMGSFLFMGLIGIVVASIVNMFLGSSMMQFIISVVGVLVFVGLTAYDTQGIKATYSAHDDGSTAQKKAIHGALRLYLDFINLFMMLLHLFGNRE
jgi:uncharacterized protein